MTIAITGGGSGQGLSDVKDGKAQIGRSDVFAEEKLDAADAANDNTVCVVGMGPVVNSNVDVDDLTTEQLKGIFTVPSPTGPRSAAPLARFRSGRAQRLAPAPVPP